MSRTFFIVVLPGDGVGVEVSAEAVKVLESVEGAFSDISFRLEEHRAGAEHYLESGTDMPDSTWAACRSADAIFLGAMGLPAIRRADGTEIAPQLELRFQLDLYAGFRPVYLFHEEHTPLKGRRAGDIDLALVRESTEGLFVSRDRGIQLGDDVVVDHLVVTRKAARRIVQFAVDLAMARHKKRRVTCVDKSNAFLSYAFFRKVFDETVSEYPDIGVDHAYIDAMALYLVRRPEDFDVIVTENMFGDILSDLAAGLVGGMGMAPSGDIGREHAVFQPAHGSAPDIAGTGAANPVAAILSVAMMLEYLYRKHGEAQLAQAAEAVRSAVQALFAEQPRTTPDLRGSMSCAEVGSAICQRIKA